MSLPKESGLDARQSHDRAVGDMLLATGLSPVAVLDSLVKQGYERANVGRLKVAMDVIRLLPEVAARRHRVFPVALEGNTLVLATFNPSPQVERMLTMTAGRPVRFVVATPDEINEAIDHHYRHATNLAGHLEPALKGGDGDITAAVTGGDSSPVAQTVDLILRQGVKLRSSDIHLEPQPPVLRVRYRIDGVLQEAGTIPLKMGGPIVSRIKILASLDLVEHNVPQDGQMEFRDEKGQAYDVRVNVMPTVHGPKAVLRVLDKRRAVLSLSDLGYVDKQLTLFRSIIHAPTGMVLVVGPTGSGKSTTLYASIGEMDTSHMNVVTLEDPVEYRLPGITQTQVNTKAGMTFAAGLRSVLRQDPDVIVVGEIRDQETADIAFRSAMTGHLVLATLHATDTTSAVGRLSDIGVDPYVISAALNGVVSQRLVRRNCDRCISEQPLTAQEKSFLARLGIQGIEAQQKGVGCNHCNHSGFRGREATAEVLVVSEEIRRLIAQAAPVSEIRKTALQQGLITLQASAFEKVRKGLCTVHEVMRAVYH